MTTSWIPSLYNPVEPRAGESLAGFLVRQSSANQLEDPRVLLKEIERHTGSRVRTLTGLQTSSEALGILGQMTTGSADTLQGHLIGIERESHAIETPLAKIDSDAMYLGRGAQLCPECLLTLGFAMQQWEFTWLAACPIHRTPLIDRCPSCRQPIRALRQNLFYCSECGSTLCEERRPQPQLENFPLAFEALSTLHPIPWSAREGMQNVPWNYAFRILKLLANARCTVPSLPKGRNYFLDLDPLERHLAYSALAPAFAKNGLIAKVLRKVLYAPFAYLDAIPRANVVSSRLRQVLVQEFDMSWELATALSQELLQAGVRGVTRLSADTLMEEIGWAPQIAPYLVRKGMLPPAATKGEEFPTRDLCAALVYLGQSPISCRQLERVVGVPFIWRSATIHLQGQGEISTVRPTRIGILIRVQGDIRNRVGEAMNKEVGIPISSLTHMANGPAPIVFEAISQILNGKIQPTGWCAPYRWADIRIREEDAAQLASLRPSL
jgi:hypothetical protein